MKKMIVGAFLILASFGIAQKSEAQIRFGININIGDQPSWRAPGYDYVEYYYLPDIEAYYYVPRHQFIYMSNGRWVFSSSLPYRYRDYNLYSGYKVVVNRPNAYQYYDQHRRQYQPRNNGWRNDRNDRNDWDNGRSRHDNGKHKGWKNHR